MTSRAEESVAMVARRIAENPEILRRTLTTSLPDLPELNGRWLITGVGGSEGPAQLLAWLLRNYSGVSAEYVPMSWFVMSGPCLVPDTGLFVFSYGLSPNAQTALRAKGFKHKVLVTGMATEQRYRQQLSGITVIAHEPHHEDQLLVRVCAPSAANLVALRIAELAARRFGRSVPYNIDALAAVVDSLPTVRDRAKDLVAGIPGESLFGRVECISFGAPDSWFRGIQCRWSESLGTMEPPVWDILRFAHGPFQSCFSGAVIIISLLERGNVLSEQLHTRLQSMLDPLRHRLVRCESHTSGVLSLLEYETLIQEVMLHALREQPRDLIDWPGKTLDAPLYDIGLETDG